METNYNQESEQNNAQFGGTGNNNTVYIPRPMSAFSLVISSFLICVFLGWFGGIPSMVLLAKSADYLYKAQESSPMQLYYLQKAESYRIAFVTVLPISIIVVAIFYILWFIAII